MQVMVLYYSKLGSTKRLAEEIARGVISAGAKAAVRSTAEVKSNDFFESAGIIAGSPVYFGSMAADLKQIFEECLGLVKEMENKIGAAFATSGHNTGGQETALLSILQCMLTYGMIVVGEPMSASGNYGVTCVGIPDKTALDAGFKLGKRVAELCKKLH